MLASNGHTVTIIGLGLIGGSLGLALRKHGISNHIIGVDRSEGHRESAIAQGIVDRCEELKTAISDSDIIIVATPVNSIPDIVHQVLDKIKDHQIVLDMGSTKEAVIDRVKNHPMRSNFVACHPMAGTEYSGPTAAEVNLFDNKYMVICNSDANDDKVLAKVQDIFGKLNMHMLYQNAKDHDMHVAYVSHISHISSFALALTVLNKEKDEDKIFELASSGFGSTVRLAKSAPQTWMPIFEQNRDNLLEVLDEHIHVLSNFRSHLIKKNYNAFYEMIENANEIKRIIK